MKKFYYLIFGVSLMLMVNVVDASTLVNENKFISNTINPVNYSIKLKIEQYYNYTNILRRRGPRGDKSCKEIRAKKGKLYAFSSCYFPRAILFNLVLIILALNLYRYFNPMYRRKKIKFKNVDYFTGIPCNNDLFLVAFLMKAYRLNKKDTDLIGTLLVKWLTEKKITITNYGKGNFIINLSKDVIIHNVYENKLYSMLIEASLWDYKIDISKFKKWSYENYTDYFNWYEKIFFDYKNLCLEKRLIIKNPNKSIFYSNIFSYTLHNEAIKLFGLKKYLLNISKIDNVQFIDSDLWKTYLIYTELLGITDKFYKELKKCNVAISPDIFPDYDNIKFINNMCTMMYKRANHILYKKEALYDYKERRNIYGKHSNHYFD